MRRRCAGVSEARPLYTVLEQQAAAVGASPHGQRPHLRHPARRRGQAPRPRRAWRPARSGAPRLCMRMPVEIGCRRTLHPLSGDTAYVCKLLRR